MNLLSAHLGFFIIFPRWVLSCNGGEGGKMPHKPLKPCKYPGCPKLTSGLYCEDHAGKMASDYNKYSRSPDHNKRYGREWRRIRNLYASQHPLCERCLLEGKITPLDVVHHILPLNRGGTNDWGNLRSLCNSCHQLTHLELGDKVLPNQK